MSFLGPIGTIISGVSAIQQGDATAKAAKIEAQARSDELARGAQITKINAEQSQAARLDDLQRTQGTIRATLAGRGLNLASPSSVALEEAASNYSQRDIMRERFNAGQQIGNMNLAGRNAIAMGQFKAKVARNAGYMQGVSSFFKAAGEIASQRG